MDQPAKIDSSLFGYSAEFTSNKTEEEYLKTSWPWIKQGITVTLLVVAFMTVTFFVRDYLETANRGMISILLFSRIVITIILLGTVILLAKAKTYFKGFHILVLLNQMLIAGAIFILAVVREMPVAYLGVNTMLFTVVYYQFMANKFWLTVISGAFLSIGALTTGFLFLDMDYSLFLASVLFLIPINFLGIAMLKSNNRNRRERFIATEQLRIANNEKEDIINELKNTLAEVKVLRGFLPVCANCKNVRDDEGYWGQIETYLQNHAEIQFTHGLCPDCQDTLYGDEQWYKKYKEKKTSIQH